MQVIKDDMAMTYHMEGSVDVFRFVLVGEIQRDFVGVFNKTIIPLALVGYEMIIANSALRASLAIYHLISNAPSWNNC